MLGSFQPLGPDWRRGHASIVESTIESSVSCPTHILPELDLHVKQRQAVDMPASEDLLESLTRIRLSVLPALEFHSLLTKRYFLLDLSAFIIELGSWHDQLLS